jgi:hypothetical protein
MTKQTRYKPDRTVDQVKRYAEMMEARGRKPKVALYRGHSENKKIVRHLKDTAARFDTYGG